MPTSSSLKLQMIITAKEVASKAFDDVKKHINEIDDQTLKNMKTIGKWGAAVSAATLAAGAGMAIAAADFESQMANVDTLLGGNQEHFEQLKDGVLEFARESSKPIEELTAATYDLVSAGVAQEDQLQALRDSEKLAVAGLGTVKEATDLVTSSMNAFGVESTRAAEVVFTAVKNGKTTVAELAQGFGGVSSTVQELGIQYEEFLAITAAATTTGKQASQAYTEQKAILSALLKPTKEMSDLYEKIGVTSGRQLIETSGGLVEALKQLKTASEVNDETFAKALSSVEGLSLANQVLGASYDSFKTTFADMTDGVASLDEAYDKQRETAKALWSQTRNNLMTLFIQLGEVILPAVAKALEIVNKFVDAAIKKWNDLSPAIKDVVVWTGALVAGIGGMLAVQGAWAASILALRRGMVGLGVAIRGVNVALLTNPIVLAIAAAASFQIALMKVRKEIDLLVQQNLQIQEGLENSAEATRNFGREMEAVIPGVQALAEAKAKTTDEQAKLNNLTAAYQQELGTTKSIILDLVGAETERAASLSKQLNAQGFSIDHVIQKYKEEHLQAEVTASAIIASEEEITSARALLGDEQFRKRIDLWREETNILQENLRKRIEEEKLTGKEAEEARREVLKVAIDSLRKELAYGGTINDQKLAILKKYALNDGKVRAAISHLEAEQVLARLKLAEQEGLFKIGAVEELLKVNADASNEELKLYADKLTKEHKAAAKFKNNLSNIFNKTLFQEVKVVTTDESTSIFDKIKNSLGLVKGKVNDVTAAYEDYNSEIGEIQTQFEAARNAILVNSADISSAADDFGDAVGGAGGKAKKTLEDLQAEFDDAIGKYNELNSQAGQDLDELRQKHEENMDAMNGKINELKGNLSELEAAFKIQMGEITKSVGEEVVKQEELIQDLRDNLKEAEDQLAKARDNAGDDGNKESIKSYQEKVESIKAELKKEEAALRAFNENQNTLLDQQAEKVKQLKEQLADASGTENQSVIEKQLEREKAVLEVLKGSIGDVEAEIEEARRRASLTDFERFIEDSNAKKLRLAQDLVDRKLLIQDEINAVQAQRDAEVKVFNEKIAKYEDVKSAFTDMKNLFESGLGDMAETAEKKVEEINSAISGLREALAELSQFNTTKLTEQNFQSGNLPQFASGGIVNKPTVAMIGEGSRPEAVVPLPNGREIPVEFKGAQSSGQSTIKNISILEGAQIIVKDEADENRLVEKIKAALVREIQLKKAGSS